MKRDMELVRRILLELEESPKATEWMRAQGFYGYDPELVAYHYKILHEAGLIEAEEHREIGRFNWSARFLTWQGHEFLDAARNDTIWNKAKEKFGTKALGMSFELAKALLTDLAKDALGIRAGS